MPKILIEAKHLIKRFSDLKANDDISLTVEEGEIHGIVGENGAGKSTLMKILYGMFSPDSGELKIRGSKVQFRSSMDALRHGIGMVHQHFMLIDRMKVIENLVLGSEPSHFGIVDENAALRELDRLMKDAHIEFDAQAEVRQLDIGLQQRLEILKLLYRKSDCLIFDEPTGVLTPQEVDEFLNILRELRSRGKTILLITHKLPEVLAVCDRVTVLRAGRFIETRSTQGLTIKELARLLVGRDVRLLDERLLRESRRDSSLRLEVKKVSSGKLKELSFEMRAGEILGIAGIEGNGQRELAEVLWGSRSVESGTIRLEESRIESLSIIERKEKGISFIPEDRQRQGLVLDLDLVENFYLGSQHIFKNRFFLPKHSLQDAVRKSVGDFEIKTTTIFSAVKGLSGGNQQKLVVARELYSSPKFLIAAQPTRGVDIGAIERIHQEIIDRRNQGMSILLISSELDELLTLSDRILVMREGIVSAEITNLQQPFTDLRYQIGEAML